MKAKHVLMAMLAVATALVACQRESEKEINPTYDPVANTVNTQFIVNVSTGTGDPKTKQSAVDVQAGGQNFRGITAAHILTYNLNYTGVGGAHYLWKVDDPSSIAQRDYDMGDLVTTADITDDDQRRILELALPLGTNTILIYGHAPITSTRDAQGYVKYSGTALNTSLSNVSFTLANRMTDSLAFKQGCDLFGRILTGIMNSGLVVQSADMGYKVPQGSSPKDNTYAFWWPITDDSKTWSTADGEENKHAGYTLYKGSIRWKDYGDLYASDPTSMRPLEEILGEAYNQVMTLKGTEPKTELRAGAAVTICRLVLDMYNVVARVLNAEPTTAREYIATLLAQEIVDRAAYFFEYNASLRVMNFKPRADIMDAVDLLVPDRSANDYPKVTEDFFYHKNTGESDTRADNLGFPSNLNLPVGSAIMQFRTVGPPNNPKQQYIVVTYPMKIPAYGMGSDNPGVSVTNYRFPAELVYYSNSSIRTSDEAVDKQTGYPAKSANWNNESFWNAQIWNKTEVEASTTSVAVSKTINYGTALLKSRFAYSESTIHDNNGGVHQQETDNIISVDSGNKFKVTGILIGGMNDEVGWNFLAKSTEGFNKMIYDRFGDNSFFIPPYTDDPDARVSLPVYTCVWDNYDPGKAPNQQSKVYVGLELVNNTGQDIWGELNLIRNGGTFYLVGELDPTAEGVTDNLKKNGVLDLSRADCFYPPFDNEGKTINAPRVFMQDYMTSVTFKFGPQSLKHAYVTMPDLRAGQISLGMSVDLKWESGLDFNVVMGDVTGN